MSRKARSWSFEKATQEAQHDLNGTYALDRSLALYKEWSSEPDAGPHQYGGFLRLCIAVTRWSEALLLASRGDTAAWRKAHLVWRYYALGYRVYLERLSQLAAEHPDRLKRGRLGIGLIECQFLAQLLMVMAFSAALGEDEAATWFGDRCLKMVIDHEPILVEGALTTGTTQLFLLQLYCRWRALEFDSEEQGVEMQGPFQRIFDNWDNAESLEDATLDLCNLHSAKSAGVGKPDDDFVFALQTGPYRDFPVEILLLQRVRRDLGLSVPNPEHPLLRSPLTSIPFPCPRSGWDECASDAYAKCKAAMPNLRVSWEDEIGSNP
jgi:hypothetical protein